MADAIYLSTGVQTLLFTSSLYSIGIALYTHSISKKTGKISWIFASIILLLASLKYTGGFDFIYWWHIWTLQFVQIHLLFISQQQLPVQKNRLHLIGGGFLILEIIKHLAIVEIPTLFLLSFLSIYSIILLVGILYRNEKANDTIKKTIY